MKISKIVTTCFCVLLLSMIFSSQITLAYENYNINTGLIKNGTIKLYGTFDGAIHFRYRKIIGEDKYFIGISIIRFKDADVDINEGEFNYHGSGILFVYRYRGLYDHNLETGSLSIDGKGLLINLKIK